MSPRRRKQDLGLLALEVQLYLADRHNLGASETAIVFAEALADSVVYSLKEGSTVDQAVDAMTAHIKSCAAFRLANPPDLGLKQIISEYKRTGGKVLVS